MWAGFGLYLGWAGLRIDVLSLHGMTKLYFEIVVGITTRFANPRFEPLCRCFAESGRVSIPQD